MSITSSRQVPDREVEVGRKWNTEETHGICTCLAKAPVSFHLRRSLTLSECGTCQEHNARSTWLCSASLTQSTVCQLNRRKPSQIPSKENVVIAKAVWRSGLEFSGGSRLSSQVHFSACWPLPFLRGRKKKRIVVLLRKLKAPPCDRSNCHLAAQHSTRARSSLSHREADAGKNRMDKTKEKGQN